MMTMMALAITPQEIMGMIALTNRVPRRKIVEDALTKTSMDSVMQMMIIQTIHHNGRTVTVTDLVTILQVQVVTIVPKPTAPALLI